MYKFDNIEKSQITKHLNLKDGDWKVVGLFIKSQEKWTSFRIFVPIIMFKTCSVLQNIAGDLMFWFNHWKQKTPKWIFSRMHKKQFTFQAPVKPERFRNLKTQSDQQGGQKVEDIVWTANQF